MQLPTDVPIRDLIPQIADWMRQQGSRDPSLYNLGRRQPRGPNGRKRCRWCGAEVPSRRRGWCSQACVDEYVIRTDARLARQEVWERDRGICQLCGVDLTKLESGLPLVRAVHGWPPTRTLWEADHVLGVADGGGMCGLEGLRLVCCKCHPIRSGAQRRARNRASQGVTQLRLM